MTARPDAASVEAALAAIEARLGPAAVIRDAMRRAPYEREMRGLYHGSTPAVVKPASVEEMSFAVSACASRLVPVVPVSGGTGLTGGAIPFGGIVLSSERMSRIREIDAANASMTVEAGCILRDVQDAAAAEGLLFPLSLPSEGSCRIGGNLSTNAGGTAVLRYGNARDLVLGIEAVLADGRIWNGLKALRKDNAGYDMKHLFIGSEGTLGIITAATLKLFPRPARRAVAFCGASSPHSVLKLFERARAACGSDLSAFEILPLFAVEIAVKNVPGNRSPLTEPYPWHALIELSSPSAGADLAGALEALLGQAMEDGLVLDAAIGASEAQNAGIWRLRETITEAQVPEGGSIKHDISVPVSKAADFMVAAIADCERAMPGVRPCAFGHIGDGNIHFNLSQPPGMARAEFLSRWAMFNTIVHDRVMAMGGSISAEHGIGLMKRDELVHYKDAVTIDLMIALKKTLDPLNILNPGKVVRIGDDLPQALPR